MTDVPTQQPQTTAWPVERRRALLTDIPLFAHLPSTTLNVLAVRFRPKAVPRSGFVFREGDPANSVNVAAAGRIKIVRETAAGRQVILRLIVPGELFGVSGGWGTTTYPVSACALDQAVVLHLPAPEFTRLLTTSPEPALAVIRELSTRLRELEARILDAETADVEARLARALLRLASHTPTTTILLSRQDLANLTGTTLSTTSRTLAAWHRRGIVAALRERVTIIDRAALAIMAAET